jgi:hypothetical protein
MKNAKPKKIEFLLELGVPQDNLEHQLAKQNVEFDEKKIRRFDKFIRSLIKMKNSEIITKKQFNKIVNVIYLETVNHIHQHNSWDFKKRK